MGLIWWEITLRRHGEAVLFDLDGRLCLCEEGFAEIQTLIETVARLGYRNVKLNLERFPYLDSAALGCLVRSVGRAKEHGAQVTFINAQPRVLKLLEVTGLSFLAEA